MENIEETMKKIENLSHDKTILFFEVPNCFFNKKIQAPHTYYFTRDFFFKSYEKVDFCKTPLIFPPLPEHAVNVIIAIQKNKK